MNLKTSVAALFLILSITLNSFAQQTCDCCKDLDTLYIALKTTPSYKDQIVGDKAIAYEKLYQALKREIKPGTNDLDCFFKLSQLVLQLKDNHLGFYQYHSPAEEIKSADFTDSTFIRKYKASATFKNFPRSNVNTDSLEKEMVKKDTNNVEGIYYWGNALKAAIYRTNKKDSLVGVILQSALPTWERGQICLILKEKTKNQFIAYGADAVQKTFILFQIERFLNQSLMTTNWRKFPGKTDYVNNYDRSLYSLKRLDTNIQYLRLGSFATSPEKLSESQAFYNTIKDSLNAANLIVDIRNNTGGGYKNSSKYLSILKRYVNPGKIFLLVNTHTISNAEQFTIKLRPVKEVLILGQVTKGMIAYGINEAGMKILPGGKLGITLTDLDASSTDVQYEDIGIEPDVTLNPDRDWIEQVKEIIRSGKKP